MRSSSLRRLLTAGLLVAAGLAAAPFTPAAPAAAVVTVVYVVPGGAGAKDGSSWANARNLVSAMGDSVPGQQLWVKAGTYVADEFLRPEISFELRSGVAVYGGFDGTETSLAQRDPAANETILDGDTNGDGGPFNNAYNVVTADDVDATAVLDGFTITNGLALGDSFPQNGGGGVNLQDSSPQLSNLLVTGNEGRYGGGLQVIRGNPSLTNVTISDNLATEGGGVYNGANVMTLDDVTIVGNSAFLNGGGISNGGGLVIDRSTISQNTASAKAPGIDGGGGGLYTNQVGSVTARNTTISGNVADGYGGAIYHYDPHGTVPLALTNVSIAGNHAVTGDNWLGIGGGLYLRFGEPKLTNVVLSGNKADVRGGAMYSGGRPTMVNVTIAGNAAPEAGGLYVAGLPPTIRNSILWANGQSYIDTSPFAQYDVLNSIVQGGAPGTGNMNKDPLFVTAVPPAPSTGGNLLPDAGSPAINKGNNAHLPAGTTVDIRGQARINGGTVDMGAIERQGDVTAPTVVARTPGNGAVITTAFTATFSEPVTGVGSSTFTLSNGATPIPGSVTRTATTATFTPKSPLVPGEEYTARLLAGIKDAAGNPLAPVSWTRRTWTVVDDKSPALVDSWDRDAEATASGGYVSAANRAGHRKTFQFTGTDVAVLGTRAPDGGYATVLIDGVVVGQANFYRSVRKSQLVVFSRTGLSNAPHTLEIRVRGTHPAGATGDWVYVDAFQVAANVYQENSTKVRDYFSRTSANSAYGGSYEVGSHATTGDTGSRPFHQVVCRGTDLKVYGTRTPTSGQIKIYVDNVAKATVNLAGSPTTYQQLLYDSPPLTDARHTIRIDALGTATGAGSDTGFDYLRCG